MLAGEMIIVILKKRVLYGAVALVAAAVILVAAYPSVLPAFAQKSNSEHVLILDAGHGGADGGAVSDNGIVESELNLEITKRLALLMVFCGQRIALTRVDSNDLASDDATTAREKKVSDLKNRVAAINSIPNATLISIHQNSIQGYPSVHGAQAFFNKQAGGEQLASVIQDQLNRVRNIDNEKLSKKIDDNIYLMNRVNCPAVLVECGFLSNSAEVRELCTPDCQIQLVLAVASGYLTYTSEGIS